MIKTTAYPRAAVIGNPSDGYHGKTIAFVFDNFKVDASIEESSNLIISNGIDSISFPSLQSLCSTIKENGYDTDQFAKHKLALATINFLSEGYLNKNDARNFKITYQSDIPFSVGLAGSSAIITAIFRGLYDFFDLEIDQYLQPDIILQIENKELGIQGGLQDRVAQIYESPLLMNFDQAIKDQYPHGQYQKTGSINRLNCYIAYPTKISENSNIIHSDLRSRFDNGDPVIIEAMRSFGDMTTAFHQAFESDDVSVMHTLINDNFDLRKSIMTINPQFDSIIQAARSTGASSKFTGSGGAIIGLYKNAEQFDKLRRALEVMNVSVLKPNIINA